MTRGDGRPGVSPGLALGVFLAVVVLIVVVLYLESVPKAERPIMRTPVTVTTTP